MELEGRLADGRGWDVAFGFDLKGGDMQGRMEGWTATR